VVSALSCNEPSYGVPLDPPIPRFALHLQPLFHLADFVGSSQAAVETEERRGRAVRSSTSLAQNLSGQLFRDCCVLGRCSADASTMESSHTVTTKRLRLLPGQGCKLLSWPTVFAMDGTLHASRRSVRIGQYIGGVVLWRSFSFGVVRSLLSGDSSHLLLSSRTISARAIESKSKTQRDCEDSHISPVPQISKPFQAQKLLAQFRQPLSWPLRRHI
jgi:hypothetical protein